CFLLAGLADFLGLSREMGALIAGVAISTFPYTLDVAAKVTSLRDFFVTLFFVALGMSIPAPTSFYIGWSAVLAAFVIFSRFVTVFPTLYWLKIGLRGAVLPSIYLAQISELSLVILALGVSAHHIDKDVMGIAAYAFVMLGILSTYAIAESGRLVGSMVALLKRLGLRDLDSEESGSQGSGEAHPHGARVVLLGFSWTASSLLEEIIRKDQPLLKDLAVIDFNPVVHERLKARGVRAIYGDITQHDTLIHAGVSEAEIIICTLPNTVLKGMTNLRLLQMLRQINPTAHVITHAELFTDVPKLYAAGASYVSVPRLIEAIELFEVLRAARIRMIDEKTGASQDELHNRNEVIP
ncbi:MAG: cation:proton antiporter, partial [Opitutaceae bacterium]|nr:cation:proton antiporter [Verrucomicrobiales bacterium]